MTVARAVIAYEGGPMGGSGGTWTRMSVEHLAGSKPRGALSPVMVEERSGLLYAVVEVSDAEAIMAPGARSFEVAMDAGVTVHTWPLPSVLERLVGAANHLHHDHDCDAHGWEGVRCAVQAAGLHLEVLKSQVYPPMTPETLAEIVRGAIQQGRREALTEVADQLERDAAGARRSEKNCRTPESRRRYRDRAKSYDGVAWFCRWSIQP